MSTPPARPSSSTSARSSLSSGSGSKRLNSGASTTGASQEKTAAIATTPAGRGSPPAAREAADQRQQQGRAGAGEHGRDRRRLAVVARATAPRDWVERPTSTERSWAATSNGSATTASVDREPGPGGERAQHGSLAEPLERPSARPRDDPIASATSTTLWAPRPANIRSRWPRGSRAARSSAAGSKYSPSSTASGSTGGLVGAEQPRRRPRRRPPSRPRSRRSARPREPPSRPISAVASSPRHRPTIVGFPRRSAGPPMRLAILSDIHSNLPALEAVLAAIDDAERRRDLVPGRRRRLRRPAGRVHRRSSPNAASSAWSATTTSPSPASWTSRRSRPRRRPPCAGRSATLPTRRSASCAASPRGDGPRGRALPRVARATPSGSTCSGPIRRPSASTTRRRGSASSATRTSRCSSPSRTATGSAEATPPQLARGAQAEDGRTLDLAEGRWLINPGSVGQPRDGDPRAAWLELDTDAWTATYHRVDYDIERAAEAILDADLPSTSRSGSTSVNEGIRRD